MPISENKKTSTTGIKVVKFDHPDNSWQDYGDLPGDRTPGNPMGQHAAVWQSADGRISVGLWRRDADFGDLLGSGQCFDFVLEGEVTVTDSAGKKHIAQTGDLLIYSEQDQGSWEQPAPIRKLFIHVHK